MRIIVTEIGKGAAIVLRKDLPREKDTQEDKSRREGNVNPQANT